METRFRGTPRARQPSPWDDIDSFGASAVEWSRHRVNGVDLWTDAPATRRRSRRRPPFHAHVFRPSSPPRRPSRADQRAPGVSSNQGAFEPSAAPPPNMPRAPPRQQRVIPVGHVSGNLPGHFGPGEVAFVETFEREHLRARFLMTMLSVFLVLAAPPGALFLVLLIVIGLAPAFRAAALQHAAQAADRARAAAGGPSSGAPLEGRIVPTAHGVIFEGWGAGPGGMPPGLARLLARSGNVPVVVRGPDGRLVALDPSTSMPMTGDGGFLDDPESAWVALGHGNHRAAEAAAAAAAEAAREAASAEARRRALAGVMHGPYCAAPKTKTGDHDGCRAGGDEDTPSCVVCLDDLEGGQDVATLRCAHQFHFGCIREWVMGGGPSDGATRCPVCKMSMTGDGDQV